jgi:hypothetical protein
MAKGVNGGLNLNLKRYYLPSPAFPSYFRASDKKKPKNGKALAFSFLSRSRRTGKEVCCSQ